MLGCVLDVLVGVAVSGVGCIEGCVMSSIDGEYVGVLEGECDGVCVCRCV